MKFMRIKTLLAALAVLTGAGAHAQAPIIIKFSHVVSPDAPKGHPQTWWCWVVLAPEQARARRQPEFESMPQDIG